MKWIVKEKVEPQEGDQKSVQKFLWFPLRIGNEIRWLDNVRVTYEYGTEEHFGVLEAEYQLAWIAVSFDDSF